MSGLVIRCRDYLRHPGDVLGFVSTGKQTLYVKKYHPPRPHHQKTQKYPRRTTPKGVYRRNENLKDIFVKIKFT